MLEPYVPGHYYINDVSELHNTTRKHYLECRKDVLGKVDWNTFPGWNLSTMHGAVKVAPDPENFKTMVYVNSNSDTLYPLVYSMNFPEKLPKSVQALTSKPKVSAFEAFWTPFTANPSNGFIGDPEVIKEMAEQFEVKAYTVNDIFTLLNNVYIRSAHFTSASQIMEALAEMEELMTSGTIRQKMDWIDTAPVCFAADALLRVRQSLQSKDLGNYVGPFERQNGLQPIAPQSTPGTSFFETRPFIKRLLQNKYSIIFAEGIMREGKFEATVPGYS